MNFPFSLRFLGVGNASASELGTSSCVLEQNHEPLLLIDCGLSTLAAYIGAYNNALPSALFITHTHLDHIGGLENLFYQSYLNESFIEKIKIFVPVKLVDTLHKRMADYPSILAEGGINFWDNFHLIPVSDHFWYQNIYFTVFPVRHHEFHFSSNLFPILLHLPSHTSIHEVKDHYSVEQLQRMIFYHYESEEVSHSIEQLGFRVARRGQVFILRNTL